MNKIIVILFSLLVFQGISSAEIANDVYMDEILKNVSVQKPYVNDNYNYESTESIAVKLKITKEINTRKDNIYDKQPVEFTVRNPVKYKNKIIFNKDDKFTAKVAIYMSRGMNGIPATIIIDDFKSNKIPQKKIDGLYVKRGLNLTPLVLPIKWALTPFPGVGSLTNLIVGGNASITPNDTVTIYYYPEW